MTMTPHSTNRRTVLALLGAGFLAATTAVATDASAGPLTDANLAEFNAGTLKHVVNSPLNSRIPSNASSPGFKVSMSRDGVYVKVMTTGEIFVPPFSYRVADKVNGEWTTVKREYPGGFVKVDETSSGGVSVVYRQVQVQAQWIDILLTFNNESNPKTVLVTLTHQQPDFSFLAGTQTRPRIAKYDAKQLGGAFVYRLIAPSTGGGGA